MPKTTPEGSVEREARRPGLSHRAMNVSRERARVQIPASAVRERDESAEGTARDANA